VYRTTYNNGLQTTLLENGTVHTLTVEETMLSSYFTRPRTGRSGDASR